MSTQHFDLLKLMAHKQSYVTVMLNNNVIYSREIAVILHNTFKTTTPLVDVTVNETL